MEFQDWFKALHPQISPASAAAVLRLSDGGATVPFIARYRKEEDRPARRGRDPSRDRGQGVLGRDRQAAGVHRGRDREPGKADTGASNRSCCRPSISRASKTCTCRTSKAQNQGDHRSRGGARTAGAVALGVRARRAAARAGRDARDARAGFLRRRQGRRRRRGRAGRRGRDRHRAASGGRGAAPGPCARRTSTGVRAHAPHRQAKPNSRFENYFNYQEPVGELRKRWRRTATWPCGAAGSKKSSCCRWAAAARGRRRRARRRRPG